MMCEQFMELPDRTAETLRILFNGRRPLEAIRAGELRLFNNYGPTRIRW